MELPLLQPRRADLGPPVFPTIAIVGLGLIGGSIALAARERWPSTLVIGVDRADVLETAMRMHAIDVGASDLHVLAGADVVILAAPVKQNVALLAQLAEYLERPAVVTDTGSTKREMNRASSTASSSVTSWPILLSASRQAANRLNLPLR